MRSAAVVVPRQFAEGVRRQLLREGRLRRDLKVRRDLATVAFPVLRWPEPPLPGTAHEESEFESAAPARPDWYGAMVDAPPEVIGRLPRAFDVIGDVGLLRLPEELGPWEAAIGAGLRRFAPGLRLVAADDGVEGPLRVRRLRRLDGSGEFRTLHRENGLAFVVDPSRAYFSPRLAREHRRVATAVEDGEAFWDLCGGVGPFGLTAARLARPGRVTIVDLNPAATELAELNARRLGVASTVRVVNAPLERFLDGTDVSGRVVLNLPLEGIKYATSVAAAAEHGTTLHYYEVMERSDLDRRLSTLPATLPPAGAWSLIESHTVHPYSPRSDLVAVTLRRSEAA